MGKGENKSKFLLSLTFLLFFFSFISLGSSWNFDAKEQFNFEEELSKFLELTDTPASYGNQANNCVKVGAGENKLVFGACSNGSSGDTNVTTACSNGEVLYGNGTCATLSIPADTDTDTWNTTSEIWAVINNNTFVKSDTDTWNTTSDIWNVINNNTFLKYGLKVGNTTSEIWTIINNGTFTDTDTFNTTSEIWAVCNNNTWIPYGTKIGNTTAEIQAVAGASNVTFLNWTHRKTTGNITNGSKVGYEAGTDICNHEYSGTHMCMMDEIIRTQNLGIYENFSATFRVSEGAPGYLANADDCGGWKSADGSSLGAIWVGDTTDGGSGSLVACNAERAIGCCK